MSADPETPESVRGGGSSRRRDRNPDAQPPRVTALTGGLVRGRRAAHHDAVTDANLEWALVADGVPYDQVYDVLSTSEGVNRAFAKLDTIKDHIIWWEAGAQPPQLLADGEVAIASAFNGRIFNAQVMEDQPFTIIWDGQVFELDGFVIPAGTPNMKAAKEFLRFATDTQRLADQAKYIAYGPARKSSAPLVSTHAETGIEMAPHMPTNPENFKTPIKKDALFWADNGTAPALPGWPAKPLTSKGSPAPLLASGLA